MKKEAAISHHFNDKTIEIYCKFKKISLFINNRECDFVYMSDLYWKKTYELKYKDSTDEIVVKLDNILTIKISATLLVNNIQIEYKKWLL